MAIARSLPPAFVPEAAASKSEPSIVLIFSSRLEPGRCHAADMVNPRAIRLLRHGFLESSILKVEGSI
jgi:hypothetical protein